MGQRREARKQRPTRRRRSYRKKTRARRGGRSDGLALAALLALAWMRWTSSRLHRSLLRRLLWRASGVLGFRGVARMTASTSCRLRLQGRPGAAPSDRLWLCLMLMQLMNYRRRPPRRPSGASGVHLSVQLREVKRHRRHRPGAPGVMADRRLILEPMNLWSRHPSLRDLPDGVSGCRMAAPCWVKLTSFRLGGRVRLWDHHRQRRSRRRFSQRQKKPPSSQRRYLRSRHRMFKEYRNRSRDPLRFDPSRRQRNRKKLRR